MTFKQTMAGVAVLLMSSLAGASVTKASWGKTANGTAVQIYTIADHDLTVRITTFGARVVSIEAPDRTGKMADVVLGYDNVGQYEKDTSTYFGSIVGRYGNRIAKGTFSIDGKTYHIPLNNNGNALHGGPEGFSTKVWTGTEIPDGVEMTLVSPDGDMGFPGTLTAHVRYTVVGHSLRINYSATTTKPTVVNLTNHSYFNLAGNGKGTILDEMLMIPADRYTPVDATQIPTGQLAPVAGTPFDFRKPTAIGARINANNEQLKIGGGYDHNWVLNGASGSLHLAAQVFDPTSGRTLTVMTTQPGVQFYSGNFLDGTKRGMYGVAYEKNAAFAMETQHFPDSPNHPKFPSTLLRPGQTMHSETVFTFGVKP
ncbi:MAG: aldose epimerase family protein [Acidobacteriaceae bacterium]